MFGKMTKTAFATVLLSSAVRANAAVIGGGDTYTSLVATSFHSVPRRDIDAVGHRDAATSDATTEYPLLLRGGAHRDLKTQKLGLALLPPKYSTMPASSTTVKTRMPSPRSANDDDIETPPYVIGDSGVVIWDEDWITLEKMAKEKKNLMNAKSLKRDMKLKGNIFIVDEDDNKDDSSDDETTSSNSNSEDTKDNSSATRSQPSYSLSASTLPSVARNTPPTVSWPTPESPTSSRRPSTPPSVAPTSGVPSSSPTKVLNAVPSHVPSKVAPNSTIKLLNEVPSSPTVVSSVFPSARPGTLPDAATVSHTITNEMASGHAHFDSLPVGDDLPLSGSKYIVGAMAALTLLATGTVAYLRYNRRSVDATEDGDMA